MCVSSDDVQSKAGTDKHTEYRDDDEEFTLERTCTKTTEKITANRKSRSARREIRDDTDQRVSECLGRSVSSLIDSIEGKGSLKHLGWS